jgi:hypothetical protein
VVFSKMKVCAHYFLVLARREMVSRDARDLLPSLEVAKVSRNIFFLARNGGPTDFAHIFCPALPTSRNASLPTRASKDVSWHVVCEDQSLGGHRHSGFSTASQNPTAQGQKSALPTTHFLRFLRNHSSDSSEINAERCLIACHY